jgi:ATP adenylyltransferase/5',5'''-P-1,P-4-tetraphosphate phosphorylase II
VVIPEDNLVIGNEFETQRRLLTAIAVETKEVNKLVS